MYAIVLKKLPPKLYTKNLFEPVYIFMTTVTLCNIYNINQTYILISQPPQRFNSLIDDDHFQRMYISYFILTDHININMPVQQLYARTKAFPNPENFEIF